MSDHFFELFRRVDHFRRGCVNSYWEKCGGGDPIARLTPRQRIHLFAVMLCEPCSLQEFMSHTGLSAPAASAAIEKLVRCGMVIRSQSETDRRSVVLTMEPIIPSARAPPCRRSTACSGNGFSNSFGSAPPGMSRNLTGLPVFF